MNGYLPREQPIYLELITKSPAPGVEQVTNHSTEIAKLYLDITSLAEAFDIRLL
jgi:hypothetical protein